jgi:ABC-type bacteriocin/lantibiotic exporter with double-glycine peptidase domain
LSKPLSPQHAVNARRWQAAEVIQTSVMDCGPAALKCLLEGFHIPASFGRLREACQTSVDGTSIDVIEAVARQLGLDAEQVMLPMDYLWLPEAEALPAMVVVQQPSGATHFVIIWRRLGRWLQIMDPALGRRWIRCERFAAQILAHTQRVAAADWYDWAASPEMLALLQARLCELGATPSDAALIVQTARVPAHWRGLATLDAAIRMLMDLTQAGGLPRGARAIAVLRGLLERAEQAQAEADSVIPSSYWSVSIAASEELNLQGAVLLRVRGCLPAEQLPGRESLSQELQAALTERPAQPLRELWELLRAEGWLNPLALLGILGLAVGGVLIETLLFRGLFELARDLSLVGQRLTAFAALLSFIVLLAALEFPIAAESLRLGRHLELRLRVALLQKLPKLNDRYFQSRPISDVAERGHSVQRVRSLPDLGLRLLRGAWDLLLTLVGIALLSPASVPLAVGIVILAVSLLLAAQPAVSERDLRAHSHVGALQGFYLDALLGLVPIRTHCAERSVRREHESLLTEWARSEHSLLRLSLAIKAAQALLCLSLAAWLLFRHVHAAGITGSLLLLVYWVLKLPALAEGMTALVLQYPGQRNVTLRLLEPLKAPEEPHGSEPSNEAASGELTIQPASEPQRKPGPYLVRAAEAVAIEMQGVSVVAAGHSILKEVHLNIRPAEHVAIVGASGAGKSSLLGLLLGWHQPAAGVVSIDDETLSRRRLLQLRGETAWVDPAVQLWNRSLLENLRYSSAAGPLSALNQILESADLGKTLVRLPEGLQALLAEGGGSLSGGEGQRVRLARALWQQGVRLALLDEPFRGLDREQRRRHLSEARRYWQDATLLCVTHDVAETRAFHRVLVVEGGHIVEDGRPEELAAQAGSHYRRLLDIEEALRHGLWNAALWRRLRLEAGRLHEAGRESLTPRNLARHE